MWFYGPPEGARTGTVVIQRLMELEKLLVPNPDQPKEDFDM